MIACAVGRPPSHPLEISNPPGLGSIRYRVGDYSSFRLALLRPLAGETQLSRAEGNTVVPVWRPGATGDLAVQLVEWWAYLADVLTFYNERIAAQSYLRTADLPGGVNRIVGLVGYRPRPGIGASGLLAALTTGTSPVTIPAGFAVQSKPGPGSEPQVFEATEDATFSPPTVPIPPGGVLGSLGLVPPPRPARIAGDPTASAARRATAATGEALVRGVIGSVAAGDELLLVRRGWAGGDADYALLLVIDAAAERDPAGARNTRLRYAIRRGDDFRATARAADYRLLKPRQSSHLYPFVAPPVVAAGEKVVHLESVSRSVVVGDPLLFEAAGSFQLVSVTSYAETIFYANNPTSPATPPATGGGGSGAPTEPAIPIPHSQVGFTPALRSSWDVTASQVRFGWAEVGTLVDEPAPTLDGAEPGPAPTLAWADPTKAPAPGSPVLIQDANGRGAVGQATAQGVQLTEPFGTLAMPVQALANLFGVTRGKTVADEVLGGGNAAIAGQEFVLQKAPVTYLQDGRSASGEDYSSTVRVRVDGIEWSEVPSFYGRAPDARIFVTREDEGGRTHVVFGDGVNGSRLPTGVGNVVASYRYGSGAEAPPAGSLTVATQPRPGLRSVVNPVPVSGGSDPDPPDRVRLLAPRSLVTLGRAVSIDDYKTAALRAPGVTRAEARLVVDPRTGRPGVTVWVDDDPGAVAAARLAFAAAADPNLQPRVVRARRILFRLSLTVAVDPRFVAEAVRAAVRSALADPDSGLLGANVVAIGQAFYESQVYAACLAVPGVASVRSLAWESVPPTASAGGRHDPGPDAYFSPADGDQPVITTEAAP